MSSPLLRFAVRDVSRDGTRVSRAERRLVTWFNPGTAASPAAFHGRLSKRLYDEDTPQRAHVRLILIHRLTRDELVKNVTFSARPEIVVDLFLSSLYSAQVEGIPTPIVSGRASKIPPIYERSTTSNISVEEGGALNVSKSCSRQPLPLSVTRGVRSRPLSDTASKAETVPLLSPTMEFELLKEPWVLPRVAANPTKTENAATISAWEEHFQDLSSWCMDTFQGQYDFPIGESTTFKLSGTKYDGNGVSTVEEEELLRDLRSTTDDEKGNLKVDTVKMTKKLSDNHHLLLSPSELANEYGLEYSNEKNNASSSWLSSESTASISTSSSKQYNADVSAPLQSEYRISGDMDYTCSISLNTTANQREMWDELRTIETTGSDTFDLLSYLCDVSSGTSLEKILDRSIVSYDRASLIDETDCGLQDEMRSSEGSVSTDSSATPKLRPLVKKSSPIFSLTSKEVKTEEVNEPTRPKRRRMETRATSTVTSSSMEVPVVSSRRSERTRITAISGKERERIATTKIKTRNKNERKRYYESESEEDVALTQYRECREKNNEASRRSRMNKKAKESEMVTKAVDLERDNKILKMKVEELEKLVTSMRNALLRCALKKEF